MKSRPTVGNISESVGVGEKDTSLEYENVQLYMSLGENKTKQNRELSLSMCPQWVIKI